MRSVILVALLIIFATLWFGVIEQRRLINPDEGRYAEIPREMAASGDWITPRLNGLKYFEKPPLQYWITAAAYTVFGEHHWTARLWPALTGFLGILFTGFATARVFNPQSGWMAGAVLASSALWNVISHANTLDTGVSFFLSSAVFALCLAQKEGQPPREAFRWHVVAWVLLALAVLSKGLIGLILPAASVFVYVVWQRDWGFIRRIQLLRGLIILLVITAPWFIAVSVANPEFAHFFFIHEHFERFLTKTHGRYQPFWYFLPVLVIGMTPWLISLFTATKAAVHQDQSCRFQPARFLLVWMIVVLVFFSASGSKLASYILPLFPTLAALIGLHLSQRARMGSLHWHALPPMLIGAFGLLLVSLSARIANTQVSASLYLAYQPWLLGASASLLVGGANRLSVRHPRPKRTRGVHLGIRRVLWRSVHPVGIQQFWQRQFSTRYCERHRPPNS